ncbi:type IV pilus modification PilV family protein [Longimicrobium sp.]|uniref:type IV pilus modification PilV family protein n=1 Tax=Longimicrobium sp. TaxID=2029185 RepID=UPI002E2EF8A0|nr:prepilin-type N-terminal cleavage/methylation domain-containing protein [Longimicrobium sp.]HEX6037272.1 prepilin-type N-terminal cleavage/methylation domain-containing protein [Longimicrobium sp.]
MRVPLRRSTSPSAAAGFTLLEVMVALVILGFVILGAQASMTSMMVRSVNWQEARGRGNQLAMDRIHAIQADPNYGTLAARYAVTESPVAGAPGFTRTTRFTATRFADGTEYQTVTVTVTAPRVPRPITRTTVIASP